MMSGDYDPHEFKRQAEMLMMDIGIPGSGNARYSAAMYFYKLGDFSTELLEIYRRCSKFDHEDPVQLAEHEGIGVPTISKHRNVKQDD